MVPIAKSDGSHCKKQWFHYECVGIIEPPDTDQHVIVMSVKVKCLISHILVHNLIQMSHKYMSVNLNYERLVNAAVTTNILSIKSTLHCLLIIVMGKVP